MNAVNENVYPQSREQSYSFCSEMQEGAGVLVSFPYTLCVPPCHRGPFRKFHILFTIRLHKFGMLTSPLLL